MEGLYRAGSEAGAQTPPLLRASSPLKPKINRELTSKVVQQTGALHEQQQLVKQYYQGSIPHVLVLDAVGKKLYNSAGEADSKHIEVVFAQSFNQSGPGTK